jgi:hypothetical protein
MKQPINSLLMHYVACLVARPVHKKTAMTTFSPHDIKTRREASERDPDLISLVRVRRIGASIMGA